MGTFRGNLEAVSWTGVSRMFQQLSHPFPIESQGPNGHTEIKETNPSMIFQDIYEPQVLESLLGGIDDQGRDHAFSPSALGQPTASCKRLLPNRYTAKPVELVQWHS